MFEIEKVDMEHIDRIRPLWEKLIQANAANSPYFADYYGTFEFEIRKGFLQEKLDNGAAMYTAVLVDREKKQDAGFVTVTYNRDTSFGEIEMLYLLEEYRGQGMGKKLFKMALSCLDINCIRDRKLCVTYGNEAALRLYESFGFYPFTIDCLQKRSCPSPLCPPCGAFLRGREVPGGQSGEGQRLGRNCRVGQLIAGPHAAKRAAPENFMEAVGGDGLSGSL